ncbi:type II toxin-antitoxin system Phd/YefM family antitoxin [Arthrobacter crystallopoietes]|uniref:type II toxin-antitoxin system Phd/YefM family antitoxin n=1 Tax=Crystallibacter crystallopoietes TaxID=37928 RepID=UPI000C75B8CD
MSARLHWSETIDKASREPVSNTRHGREAVVLMNAELAERALEALEDAEDLKAAREARAEGGPSLGKTPKQTSGLSDQNVSGHADPCRGEVASEA